MNLHRIMLGEEKSIPKGYILYNSIYIIFLKRKIMEMENRVVVVRSWREK